MCSESSFNRTARGKPLRGSSRGSVAFSLTAALVVALIGQAVGAAAVGTVEAAQHVGESGDRTPQQRRFYLDDPLPVDPDRMDIEPVKEMAISQYYLFFENSFGDPVGTEPGPALNTNTLGEVPDSSWFTNRLGGGEMSVADVVRGADTVNGPAPGTWTITGRPGAGVTPKFIIEDARGGSYFIKFDPAANPGMATMTEFVATKFFHALGYNVPENYLADLDPGQLEIAPGATFRDEAGDRHPITEEVVAHWLKDKPRSADGSIRVLASRRLPGQGRGEFRFYGTRPDDPNDIFPHEKRRELRGLRVFSAWLSHDDSRAINTFDSYVEEDGRRFVRHYLIDFGSAMGSASLFAQLPRGGYEYYSEFGKFFTALFTFGLWDRDYARVSYPDYPAVGRFEADYYEPWKWKPNYPNPAFDRMDAADAFWGARILSHMDDEMIRAVVEAARMENPEAAEFLIGTLIRRRDKTVAYWISRTNPVTGFRVGSDGTGGLELRFENAAVRASVVSAASYTIGWSSLDNLGGEERRVAEEVRSPEPRMAVPAAAWGRPDDLGHRYAVARIRTGHPEFPHWDAPVTVTLRDRSGTFEVVGVDRPSDEPGEMAATRSPTGRPGR